ncbi:glycosyltransferase [Phyllobacterium myrsinacearum]|uniref:glycosyltransferase n=1 Tax=Phyllobacterium myrsinacearum TaxID=28101 RepID=UPI0013EE9B33|nr:glycosyltransferase [Phyllobacterium myrsinacearum]
MATLRFVIRKFAESVRIFGVAGTFGRIISFTRSGRLTALFTSRRATLLSTVTDENKNILASFYPGSSVRPAPALMPPRVLIVAEMSIPQCKKYRVTQKAELLRGIGIEAAVVDWTHFDRARTLLQTHSIVIFYRVPAVPEAILLIKEAKRLGVHTFWEVDDLVFDPEGYLSNKNLETLASADRKGVLEGMKLYREALLLCDEGIASTKALARAMREVTGRNACVVENALDADTLQIAESIRKRLAETTKQPKRTVTIVYGSGTKTHDIDFLTASDALFNVLSQRPNVRLRIIGSLNIEDRFDGFADRIERYPFVSFDRYLELLAEADISIAPLEDSIFNDAKSNIKFLEASVLGVPSVCSPADAFRTAVIDGENGFLAASSAEWEQKLLRLVDQPALRTEMAFQARESVNLAYAPVQIAHRQLVPLIERFRQREQGITRILFANVYFSPQSFGGATVIAEEMARRLAQRDDVEVYVFTSWSNSHASDYDLVRYNAKDATVFAVKVPVVRTRLMDIKDDAMGQVFEGVLEAIKPDVVQLHSVQTLGVTLGSVCKAAGIPYAITLHDAWWLCERQFMVTGEGRYCFQTRIDPAVCAACVPDKTFNQHRTQLVHKALLEADGRISPSAYFKQLYMHNGLRDDQIFVNKNGVKLPSPSFTRKRSDRIRFGYVGGSTPIKGYDLVREAFSALPECGVELIMVDNTLNSGYSSVDAKRMNAHNPVRILPAYTQDTIDEFFSHIDVLLFPSQWKESFGLTVREALLRDIWVIATDSGGAVEDLTDGENGYIIPISPDSTHLRMAMERVIANRAALSAYVNPFKDCIQSFDGQAAELYQYLHSLAQKRSR